MHYFEIQHGHLLHPLVSCVHTLAIHRLRSHSSRSGLILGLLWLFVSCVPNFELICKQLWDVFLPPFFYTYIFYRYTCCACSWESRASSTKRVELFRCSFSCYNHAIIYEFFWILAKSCINNLCISAHFNIFYFCKCIMFFTFTSMNKANVPLCINFTICVSRASF